MIIRKQWLSKQLYDNMAKKNVQFSYTGYFLFWFIPLYINRVTIVRI